MSGEDRLRWDQAYHEKSATPYPPPDPLVLEFTPPLKAGQEARALDLAAGLGQNGLWLAAQGYIVDLVDISRVALLRAQAEAGRRELRNLNLLPVDLDQYEFPETPYDLVCVFRYLNRRLFTPIREAVRPGGRIIYMTYNRRYLDQRPDSNPDYLLEIGELGGIFADWKILHYLEDDHLSRIVAVKPQR